MFQIFHVEQKRDNIKISGLINPVTYKKTWKLLFNTGWE